MIHYINLHREPFEMIENGQKTIELRLNDEKRRLIKINDEIVFQNTFNAQKIIVKVIAIHTFASFEELYKKLPLDKCGYHKSELKDAKSGDMDIYYSKEKQAQYGVLGIEIELIKN